MSNNFGSKDIVSGVRTVVDIGTGGISGVLLGNESGLSVKVTLDGTGHSRMLYPGLIDFFPVGRGFNGNVILEPVTKLSNSTSWPGSFVEIDTFGINEKPPGIYPMSLTRATNNGNSLNLATSTTQLINDGNVANTQMAEATVSGDSGSAVSLTNDAILALGTAAHKGSITLLGPLSTDNGAFATDGAGDLVAKQVTHVKGATTSAGGYFGQDSGGVARLLMNLLNVDGDLHLYTTPANKKLKVSKGDFSGDIVEFNDTAGITLKLGKYNLIVGTLKSMTSGGGTGNGTINTLLGTNPTNCEMDPCTVSGSTQSIGATLTQTSTITTFSGLAWQATFYLQ